MRATIAATMRDALLRGHRAIVGQSRRLPTLDAREVLKPFGCDFAHGRAAAATLISIALQTRLLFVLVGDQVPASPRRPRARSDARQGAGPCAYAILPAPLRSIQAGRMVRQTWRPPLGRLGACYGHATGCFCYSLCHSLGPISSKSGCFRAGIVRNCGSCTAPQCLPCRRSWVGIPSAACPRSPARSGVSRFVGRTLPLSGYLARRNNERPAISVERLNGHCYGGGVRSDTDVRQAAVSALAVVASRILRVRST